MTGTGQRSFLPAEVLRGSTGSGSEAPSALEVKPGTTDVAVPISRRRLLTPWVDSFRRLPMPCVDSLRRWDTAEPPRVNPPLRSPLSMLMANRMEFKPENRRSRRRWSFWTSDECLFYSICLRVKRCKNINEVLFINILRFVPMRVVL